MHTGENWINLTYLWILRKYRKNNQNTIVKKEWKQDYNISCSKLYNNYISWPESSYILYSLLHNIVNFLEFTKSKECLRSLYFQATTLFSIWLSKIPRLYQFYRCSWESWLFFWQITIDRPPETPKTKRDFLCKNPDLWPEFPQQMIKSEYSSFANNFYEREIKIFILRINWFQKTNSRFRKKEES